MTHSNLHFPVALVLCIGLSFGAAAQTSVEPHASGSGQDSAAALAVGEDGKTLAPEEQAAPQHEEVATADRNCLRQTGSRLVRAARDGRKCVNAPGRSYSREDLERTGRTDLGAALRALDSSVQ